MKKLDRRWLTLIAVCGATFMLLVDVTIVQVALPTIQHRLHASFSDLQWVIDAYALALATLILTWGSLADRFGRKRVFLIGLGFFTVASFLCGVATSSTFLIWSRAVQGVGGAAMFATGLALIGQEFQGAERHRPIAMWGATVGAATAVGPLVGGALTSGLGWRWIFFVNVPIGVVVVWLAVKEMVNVTDGVKSRLDWAGLVTFSLAMFLLVYGFIRANADGWTSSTIVALFVAAVIVMAIFAVAEHVQQRPMFDLSLFRRPSFVGVSLSTLAIGAGMFAIYPYITFYLQNDLGYSPFQGGLRLLPSTVLAFAVPLWFRPVAERIAPRVALGTGMLITTVGLGSMVAMSSSSTWLVLVPGLLLTGIGIGIVNPAIARIALGVVAPQRAGMASGISNTFRTGGLAIGVAAFGALFERKVSSALAVTYHHQVPVLARIVASSGVAAAVKANAGRAGVAMASHDAFVSGMKLILVIGTFIVALGAVTGFAMVRARDFQALPPSQPVVVDSH
jgi:EmrB/QacA subfamily drug resistance transporter